MTDAGTEAEANAAVVRRYLRVFETRDVDEVAEVMVEDVRIRGAGQTVTGRHYVEASVMTPGLSNCRVQVEDFVATEDRVSVAFTLTYTHDATGRDVVMTGVKLYRLENRRIVEFWGETDLYGLLRQLGLVPEQIPDLTSG